MAEFDWREIWLGVGAAAITLVILVALTVGAPPTDTRGGPGFDLQAEFGNIDGLTAGSPVRMAGIDVGHVGSVSLGDHHRANVTLTIFDSNLAIPSDTAAVIETDGIFGEKYIELHPGGDIETLSPGQRISYVQDSVVLESLLNQVVNRAKASRAAEEKALP